MSFELSKIFPPSKPNSASQVTDFWDLNSGKRADAKIIVQLTPRAANWFKVFAYADVKKHFNAKTLHTKNTTEEVANTCKQIVDAITGQNCIGTTYAQINFNGHMYPSRNKIESLPACIKGYLMEHADDLDMKDAMNTIMKWYCHVFRIVGCFDCDRKEFAEQDGISFAEAKEHTNAVWTSEHKRRGPKWIGFREFEASVHKARTLLYTQPELMPIRDYVHQHFQPAAAPGKHKSMIGSFASHMYMHVMGKLLHAVQKKAESELSAVVQGLGFDGLRFVKGHTEETLVNLASLACEEVCPGIGTTWKVKPPTTNIKNGGEKKLSGYHLSVSLDTFENADPDDNVDEIDGPPVENLTNAQLQDMHSLFRSPFGIVWEVRDDRRGAKVELDRNLFIDLFDALVKGKKK